MNRYALPPALRLITKFALTIGIGTRAPLPLRRLQLIHQTGGLLGRDDELHAPLLIGLHRIPAVEARIGAGIDRLYLRRQGRAYASQVPGDLRACGPIPVAQLPAD